MSRLLSLRVGYLLLTTAHVIIRTGVVVHNICIWAVFVWGLTLCSSVNFCSLSLIPTADEPIFKHQHLHLVRTNLLIFSLCLCSVETPQPQLFIIIVMKTYTLPLIHHTFRTLLEIILQFVFHLRHNLFSLYNIWTTESWCQQWEMKDVTEFLVAFQEKRNQKQSVKQPVNI